MAALPLGLVDHLMVWTNWGVENYLNWAHISHICWTHASGDDAWLEAIFCHFRANLTWNVVVIVLLVNKKPDDVVPPDVSKPREMFLVWDHCLQRCFRGGNRILGMRGSWSKHGYPCWFRAHRGNKPVYIGPGPMRDSSYWFRAV